VPGRWSVERVLALAPDAASALAARALAQPVRWTGTGTADDLVWGSCAGSGRTLYRTAVDLTGPAFTCTCPSRKSPCKHALGLLLLWATDFVPADPEPSGFAAEWKQSRAGRPDASRPRGERDEQAAAQRAAQRQARVTAGLAELEMWLRDQVRVGLATANYGHADAVAARMVDAQAPGVAGMLRRLSALPASRGAWPAQLLAGYGGLHLLARAHAHLDQLPPPLAATVRSHVGYSTPRERVLTEEPVTDDWLVLAVRDLLDGAIPSRRIWLKGRASGRYALVLVFDPNGTFSGNPDAALEPGTALRADLHFYPGRPPLRVVVGARHAEPTPAGPPETHLDLADMLTEWATVVELDPWRPEWPAVLRGVPIPGEPAWRLATEAGAVPLLTGGADPWVLAAVAGGEPALIAGEWTAEGLRPLTVWHGDQAVRL
jgi:hypothetical protein